MCFFSQNTVRQYLVGAGFSGSLSWCNFLCVLSRLSLTFVFYKLTVFLILSRCSSLRRDPRTSFFAIFLDAFSDPRVYRYPAHLCSEVFFFLQRQKNVFKSSCRVRGMGPPHGSAFACAASTINKTKKQRPNKSQVLLSTVTTIEQFGARCENAKKMLLPQ